MDAITPQTTAEPVPSTESIISSLFATTEGEVVTASDPAAAVIATPPTEPGVTSLTFDPATVIIPKDATLPKHMQKFAGKALPDVFDNVLQTEQWGHTKAQEAALARQEVTDLRARLAAAEQVRKMTDPAAPPADDPFANVESELFEKPRDVLGKHRELSKSDAQKLVDDAKAEIRAENANHQKAAMQVATFEQAKAMLAEQGYELPHEDYKTLLSMVMPRIAAHAEATGDLSVLYDPQNIVKSIAWMKGAPPQKPTTAVPTEGAPPISARAAPGPGVTTALPTVSREHRQLYETIGRGLGFKGQDLESYITETARNEASGDKPWLRPSQRTQ